MDDAKRRLAALETWKVYRRWAVASAGMKRGRDRWKRVVFALGLLGAVLGPVAAGQIPFGPEWALRGVALVSGIAVALATYLSDSVLGPNPDVAWVRARQGAEGLKSLAFAFLLRAPPFDASSDGAALDAERARIEGALASDPPLVALPISAAEAERSFPPAPLGPAEYLAVRVREQQAWFEKKVIENHVAGVRLEVVTKALGAVAAVLAVVTAFSAGLPGWIAMVTAVAGALGARLTSARYGFLEKSYYDAAARLSRIVTLWEVSPGGPQDARRLVGDCERVLREENARWVEAMLRKEAAGAKAAAPSPAGE